MNPRDHLFGLILALTVTFGVSSCAPMKTIKSTPPASAEEKPARSAAGGKPARAGAEEKSPRPRTVENPARDPFFRIYAVPFKDFHPRLHQALQKFAREKPGNSFQVSRLGSDGVYFRGFLLRANNTRVSISIVTKPAGAEKTSLEIKPSTGSGSSSEAATASSDLFQAIEKETGFQSAD